MLSLPRAPSPFLSYRRPTPLDAERRRRQRADGELAALRRYVASVLGEVPGRTATVAGMLELIDQNRPAAVPLRDVLRELARAAGVEPAITD